MAKKYSNRHAYCFQYYKDGKRIVHPLTSGCFRHADDAKAFANEELYMGNWLTLEYRKNPAFGADMIDSGFGFFFVRQANGRFKTFGQEGEPEDFGPVDYRRIADEVDYSHCR